MFYLIEEEMEQELSIIQLVPLLLIDKLKEKKLYQGQVTMSLALSSVFMGIRSIIKLLEALNPL
jgi:hypothetical protein